jgi:hypothetical protein
MKSSILFKLPQSSLKIYFSLSDMAGIIAIKDEMTSHVTQQTKVCKSSTISQLRVGLPLLFIYRFKRDWWSWEPVGVGEGWGYSGNNRSWKNNQH